MNMKSSGSAVQMNKFLSLLGELYQNRALIWKLAKNDFKTRYAGSYLGIIWAFIQPVVTVCVYWFVFGVVRSGAERTVPFVLWLVCGIVPWFFFQEALVQSTDSLMAYDYLVKKVVFKISILPIVRIMAALFVHVFFVIFTIVLFAVYGYWPDLYSLQILYYSICAFLLVLALSYTTCAVVVFFRDLKQIIGIGLQIGVWMTPIMWSFQDMGISESSVLVKILKLNPMFYVVNGYRDAFIHKVWFWEHPQLTLYFWCFTIVVFLFGARLFKKLKIHFADVL